MDQRTRDNWLKVKVALEAAGKTDTFFYVRAVAICKGGSDPFESNWPGQKPKIDE
jgi:hypothetical protein